MLKIVVVVVGRHVVYNRVCHQFGEEGWVAEKLDGEWVVFKWCMVLFSSSRPQGET